jgi:hypothetical protein
MGAGIPLQPAARRPAALLLCAALLACTPSSSIAASRAAAVSAPSPLAEDESVHVAFCAECKADMDWKSAGLYHSFATSGMHGRITRLLACSEEQLAKYPRASLEMGPTYVHRNYRTHPRVPKDNSGSYNKVGRTGRQGRAP